MPKHLLPKSLILLSSTCTPLKFIGVFTVWGIAGLSCFETFYFVSPRNDYRHPKGTLGILMENYSKGKNVEEEWIKEKIPIPNLPKDFLWMQVKAGSKMHNLLSYALKEFKDKKEIVWSGTGPAISKTISCAEITKRENPGLHQINKICSRKFEEHWEPKINGLAPLIVQRDVPTIHILLSREPLCKEEPGYQDSELHNSFWKSSSGSNKKRPNKAVKLDDDHYLSMGLRIGKHKYLGKNKPSRTPRTPSQTEKQEEK